VAYDEALAARVRLAIGRKAGVTERKMFGGLAFLRHGNMFCGLIGSELMVRVGPARYEEALRAPHARPMDFTGRPLAGYVYVAAAGCRTVPSVNRWVKRGLIFAQTLPAKRQGTNTPRRSR
jgi:TfoX/Sxy family transcriptional regulator of competence genes